MNRRRRICRSAECLLAAAVLLACSLAVGSDTGAATGAAAEPGTVVVTTAQLRLAFSEHHPGPISLTACVPTCESPRARTIEFIAAREGSGAAGGIEPLPPPLGDTIAAPPPVRVATAIELREAGTHVDVYLRVPDDASGPRLEQRWRIPREGYRLSWQTNGKVAGTGLRLATGDAFQPAPMPGFSHAYAAVRAFTLKDGEVHKGTADPAPAAIGPGEWAGVRSRFWALAASPATPAGAELGPERQAVLRVPGAAGMTADLYAGPVARDQLFAADDGLDALLYADLWTWLRWLSRGLRVLMDGLMSVVGNAGVAILLLSVVVRVLMSPVTAVAERWQADVNRTQARLEPLLAEARANYTGEARHERTLAAYRSLGVSPWYTLKSLAGYLIQIPVFVAAFTMLGENFALAQTPFLWIDDLSRPDALLPLPLTLPFFGSDLNLLPFLMTGLTLLAALLHEDSDLTPALLRAQRRRLYGLAGLFFLLFYTFPAGMVLYWTMNNLLHLVTAHWRNAIRPDV